MNQPDFATIRLYSKVRRTLQNMSNDQDMNILMPALFPRLSAVKKDLEQCFPGIERIAPDDPRIYETEVSNEREDYSAVEEENRVENPSFVF